MKKFFAILMSLALMLSLAVPAMADDATPATYTITINNTVTGYTYEAYQIFTGDLSEQGNPDASNGTNAKLSNIVWGSGVDQTGLIAALKNLTFMSDLADTATAADVAEKLNDLTYNSDAAKQFAEVISKHLSSVKATSTENKKTEGDKEVTENYTISSLKAGYYLIKNETVPTAGSYTEYIVEVVENSTVSPKGNVPSVEKKVKDTNDTTGVTTDWQDSADYDIGDDVPFQLTATLANNVSAYKTYKIIFHDTLSKGLTFKEITKVTVAGKEITEGYVDNDVVNKDGTTSLTITFANIKLQGGTDSSTVVVEYTATLDTDAEIGKIGNPNYVYLEYSNNPNWNGSGTPGTPEEPTGETPVDKVIVFTYETIVNKVDQNGAPLSGADFKLEKFVDDAWVEVALVKSAAGDIANAVFTATGLDDGNYRLTETQTPPGYNTITPIEFTIEADHDTAWESQAQTEVLNTVTGTNGFSVTLEKITGADGKEENVQVVGSLSTSVVNNAGATLPETGGMGTTIFYVVGGVMAAAAAILLITKKRLSNNA